MVSRKLVCHFAFIPPPVNKKGHSKAIVAEDILV